MFRRGYPFLKNAADAIAAKMNGFADLIPTRHHLPHAWIMGYDLYPTETLEFKKRILPRAVEERWMCLFYHDLARPLCGLTIDDGKIRVREI